MQNNTFIFSGESETKTIKDLLPDILHQLGPKQNKILQDLVVQNNNSGNEEEVPTLVEEAPENLDKVDEWSSPVKVFSKLTFKIISCF